MSRTLRIVISGNPGGEVDACLATARLRGFDFTIEHGDISSVDGEPDLILAPADLLPQLTQLCSRVPVVLVCAPQDERFLADAIRIGAYPVPDARCQLLEATVERALRDAEDRRERRRTAEVLAKVEERYQDLVETANDVVLAVDLGGNFTTLNAAGEQISGYTRDEVRRMNMRDVLTPESFQRAVHMIEEKLKNPHATTYELDLVTRHGSIVPLEVSSKIIFHDGKPVGVHGIARDITERRRAEEELRSRERKQAAVARLGQTALASADLPGLFQQAVDCVAETLDVAYCSIMELNADGTAFDGRAGCGWREGVIEREHIGAGPHSQAGFTLLSSEPVIVDDFATETRFSVPQVLKEHGATSGVSVIIHGHRSPFGVLSAFATERARFAQDDVHFLQAVAHVLAASIERRRLEDERAQHDKELAARVLQAQEEERKRIARELHDETAQSLSMLLTNVDLLQGSLSPQDGAIAAGLERISMLAKRALDETRALSHDLRPTILDDAGLVAALEWIAAEYERSYGGRVDVKAYLADDVSLSPHAEVALFRIAQEALTNSGKHARASRVWLTLIVKADVAELTVKDSGWGFDPERVHRPSREGGLGLYGMAERAALFGGTLTIHSMPGRGTEVRVTMPTEVETAQPAPLMKARMS